MNERLISGELDKSNEAVNLHAKISSQETKKET